jgi:DNA polymerase alpha subunit A
MQRYSLRIASDLSALPLAAQITNVCGNVLSRTLAGGRSERNEYLLLHAFTERGFIVPDKVYGKKTSLTVLHNELEADDEDDNQCGRGQEKQIFTKKASIHWWTGVGTKTRLLRQVHSSR